MHECPACLEMCYCDGEDTFVPASRCQHECELPDDEDDFDDALFCCEGAGCALCLGDEWPDRERENAERGDRQAIEAALVGTLFPIDKLSD